MLICNACTKHRSPRPHHGKCELCKRDGPCHDVHAAMPPAPKRARASRELDPCAATMLGSLADIRERLPELLESETWSGQDNPTPRVERLWSCVEGLRVFIDVVQPCKPSAALWVTSARPVAVQVLRGECELGLGWVATGGGLRVAATHALSPGAAYELREQLAWHYLLPHEPLLMLTIAGPPYAGDDRKRVRPPLPLVAARIDEIRDMVVACVALCFERDDCRVGACVRG